MTISSRAAYCVSTTRCLKCRHLCVPIRQFSFSRVVSASPESLESTKPERKPSVTRKKFSDLPSGRVLPDGSVAPALGDWSDALDDAKSLKDARQNSVDDITAPTEILDNLAKFPHCILLTRVGNFYESYFDQAAEVAKILNIKLTQRTWDGHRILMCGFPLMHLDKYLKVLVQQQNRFVAMCEEFPRNPALGPKGGFDRRVVRVITPGTLIDEPFLNQYVNNFLLAVSSAKALTADEDSPSVDCVGLAWIDVSTGEFFAKVSTLQGVRDEVARIGPKEIVLDKALEGNDSHPIREALMEEDNFVSYILPAETSVPLASGNTTPQHDTDDITDSREDSGSISISTLTTAETSAIQLLTTFLHAHLLEHMPALGTPNREATSGRMQIDSHTIKALEIREGMREGGTTGSLLSVVKRTITSGGTRLLSRWLCSPSTSINEINARQSLVAFMYNRPHLRDDLLNALANIDDATRIVQKFLVGRGDPSDLSAISATISVWSSIKRRIAMEKKMEQQEGTINADDWTSLDALMFRMADLRDLSSRINAAIRDRRTTTDDSSPDDGESEDTNADLPAVPRVNFRYDAGYRWTIKPGFSDELTQLHEKLKDLLAQREALELDLQREYDAPSLTLRSSPGYGMHVHVARAKRDQTKLQFSPLFSNIAESGSTSAFFHQTWSQLGNQIVESTTAIFNAEKNAFDTLRNEVNAHSSDLRRNARILDELDVTMAFASLAVEMNFVRPMLTDNTSYEVDNGRHPTVELGLLKAARVFTPNSVSFTPDSQIHIITGPNMAGKSTFLRQTALIAILAQTGSFVPADRAVVGIVDKLFSRVGAKDDLFRDRSTFMVEMLETAEILRRATPNSLVIMDEVGRGTTVKDGLALAFAAVHHLSTVNRCRALFATHFHELSDMLGYSTSHKGEGAFGNVSFFCTDVDETADGHFAYSHRLRPGVNRDSHGLKVARLAGMPPSAMAVAKDALHWLKSLGTKGAGTVPS
ncbi:hypothetical protein PLICRDRAFT_49405 [Plicaturopsis crispa FD-325 SS-3]|nr:hypothetical protein PLICRDRAFT_49405 [Plicaturopsis crispa FD-325 SS-3]